MSTEFVQYGWIDICICICTWAAIHRASELNCIVCCILSKRIIYARIQCRCVAHFQHEMRWIVQNEHIICLKRVCMCLSVCCVFAIRRSRICYICLYLSVSLTAQMQCQHKRQIHVCASEPEHAQSELTRTHGLDGHSRIASLPNVRRTDTDTHSHMHKCKHTSAQPSNKDNARHFSCTNISINTREPESNAKIMYKAQASELPCPYPRLRGATSHLSYLHYRANLASTTTENECVMHVGGWVLIRCTCRTKKPGNSYPEENQCSTSVLCV